jgi:hypothetical protein
LRIKQKNGWQTKVSPPFFYTSYFFEKKLIGGSANSGNGNYRSYGNNVFSENGNSNTSQNNPPQENIQYGNQIDDFLD